jgi:hypothetical protein
VRASRFENEPALGACSPTGPVFLIAVELLDFHGVRRVDFHDRRRRDRAIGRPIRHPRVNVLSYRKRLARARMRLGDAPGRAPLVQVIGRNPALGAWIIRRFAGFPSRDRRSSARDRRLSRRFGHPVNALSFTHYDLPIFPKLS